MREYSLLPADSLRPLLLLGFFVPILSRDSPFVCQDPGGGGGGTGGEGKKSRQRRGVRSNDMSTHTRDDNPASQPLFAVCLRRE